MSRTLSKFSKRFRLVIGLMGMLCAHSVLAQVITNVSVVNVTPSSFSIVWTVSEQGTPSISVYADAAGTMSLAGQVGVQWYPLHTGDPTVTNAYYRRLNKAGIQQATISQGLVEVRVTGCTPNTTCYYQLAITSTNGQQTVWPASGPLPSVTTAVENDFVLQSQQLIVTVSGASPGSIVILSNSNTPSLLAAVVGDGVASNEVFFSVNDLLAASGQTNYLPQGNQSFTAQVLSPSSQGQSQLFSLNFTGNFLVGGVQQEVFAEQPTLTVGTAVLQIGQSSNVSVSLNAPSAVTNVSFVLNFPTNQFSQVSLQPLAPQLGLSTLQKVSANSVRLSFNSALGQVLQGNEELAQINFTTVSNQPSAFVSLIPQTLQGGNADGSAATNFLVQSGRIVIIGAQPLLDSLIASDGSRDLVLYGNPGNSFQIQSSGSPNSPKAAWQNVERVPLTNLMAAIAGLDISPSSIYYRAYQFTTPVPILDSAGSAGGNEELVLYGTPWSAYEVEYTTNIASHNWTVLTRIPLTNSFQMVTGLNTNIQDVFYRALLWNADPPVLVPQLASQSRSVLVYGMPGTNYGLQYATNLSSPVTWYPLLNYRLTNAFQSITNLGTTNPSIYYRLKKQ